MTSRDLIDKYLDFFKKKDHTIIPSAPLIPVNDPTVLFVTAGMHPLVPYFLGDPHPEGKRVVNNQICLRTNDIEEVGDTSHHTFFEMLGNWSLGDYWKVESISWSYEFITKELGLDHKKLWVTCFKGDKDAPKDTESESVWKKLGIPSDRIFFNGKKDNWWGPAGEIGPCGPDSEIFYDMTGKPHGPDCIPGDNCGRFFEIWNNVFMQYNKTEKGFEPLAQKNVDTGMGVDRTTAVLQGLSDNYEVEDLWGATIKSIEEVSNKKYKDNKQAFRIVADHMRASTFVILAGVEPSNKERGYILRRLIRRAVRYGKVLGIDDVFTAEIATSIIETYKSYYPNLEEHSSKIKEVVQEEEKKFKTTLTRGLKEIEKLDKIDAKKAFFLYETYGFPIELTEEIAVEKGQKVKRVDFEKEFEKHKEKSRTASAGMFKGGLADHSSEVKRLHTATHLLQAALRDVLGEHVEQKGQNITKDRSRFDFSHSEKLTDKQLKKVEDSINEKIKEDLPVNNKVFSRKEAEESGALHFFGEKYTDEVSVYFVGDDLESAYSKEFCGGPHVSSTGKIGHVKIKKQDKVGAGIVRVYLVIDNP